MSDCEPQQARERDRERARESERERERARESERERERARGRESEREGGRGRERAASSATENLIDKLRASASERESVCVCVCVCVCVRERKQHPPRLRIWMPESPNDTQACSRFTKHDTGRLRATSRAQADYLVKNIKELGAFTSWRTCATASERPSPPDKNTFILIYVVFLVIFDSGYVTFDIFLSRIEANRKAGRFGVQAIVAWPTAEQGLG